MPRTRDDVMASLPTERRERIKARALKLHQEILDRQRALNDRSEPKSHDLFAGSDAAFRDCQAAYPDDDGIDRRDMFMLAGCHAGPYGATITISGARQLG